jgi:4-methyl-5(b-hydroxyethyl)-thiazole monophosphate biosynthesis
MKVLLFLAEGFEDLEAVSILDVMGWTEYREWVPTVEVVTTGFRPQIRSRFGLEIKPDIPVEQVDPKEYAALAVPGGFHSHGFDEAYDVRLRGLAKNIHDAGGWIATFCVGVLPVAEAGLLEGKMAVSYPFSRNHDNLARLKELGAAVADAPVVVDDRIISCAGPASSLDVAYQLLDGILGETHCAEVRRLMCAVTMNSGKGQSA